MVLAFAAVALTAARFSLALPELNSVKLEAGELALYSSLLSQKLQARGVKVITARDFSAVMGLERQKQLLAAEGCSDSCITELAAAMGVDAMVVGDIGKPGTTYALSFKVLAARDATVLALDSAQVANADLMDAALDHAAWSLLQQLKATHPELEPGPEPGVASAAGPRRSWAIAPAAVAVATLAAGAVGLLLANGRYEQLLKASTVGEAQQLRDSGKTLQLLGWVGVGVGAAAAVTAAVLFALGSRAPVTASVSVVPGGGGLAVSGAWP
ncbi:MAG: hypothetical protein IPJ65_33615 [Archangiaceae bacterium]|nr:hypothetical protein [Archangiaceae bacterium]